jgi:hypothetical protein
MVGHALVAQFVATRQNMTRHLVGHCGEMVWNQPSAASLAQICAVVFTGQLNQTSGNRCIMKRRIAVKNLFKATKVTLQNPEPKPPPPDPDPQWPGPPNPEPEDPDPDVYDPGLEPQPLEASR